MNCERGYEWWLMKEAKARNPGIVLYVRVHTLRQHADNAHTGGAAHLTFNAYMFKRCILTPRYGLPWGFPNWVAPDLTSNPLDEPNVDRTTTYVRQRTLHSFLLPHRLPPPPRLSCVSLLWCTNSRRFDDPASACLKVHHQLG